MRAPAHKPILKRTGSRLTARLVLLLIICASIAPNLLPDPFLETPSVTASPEPELVGSFSRTYKTTTTSTGFHLAIGLAASVYVPEREVWPGGPVIPARWDIDWSIAGAPTHKLFQGMTPGAFLFESIQFGSYSEGQTYTISSVSDDPDFGVFAAFLTNGVDDHIWESWIWPISGSGAGGIRCAHAPGPFFHESHVFSGIDVGTEHPGWIIQSVTLTFDDIYTTPSGDFNWLTMDYTVDIYAALGNPGGSGMEQVIFGGYSDNLHSTTTEYNALCGGAQGWTVTEFIRCQLVSTDGVLKNLRIKLNGAPGAGKSYAITLMLNGAPTALSVVIADTATTGSDTVDEIVVAGGDYVCLKCVPTGTPTARKATWTSVFESNTPNESLILGGCVSALAYYLTVYGNIMAPCWPSTIENNERQLIPTSGTIKNLYVKLDIDPGTDPDAYRFTLRKGPIAGPMVSQSLTVTITADDTTGSDLVNSFTVAAGDLVSMIVEPLNGPDPTEPIPIWGMTFVADINGESIGLGIRNDVPDATNTEYNYLVGGGSWFSTESGRIELGQECTVKKLHVALTNAPGAGKSYDFAIRIAGTNVVTLQISDLETAGDSGVLSDTVADDEYVSIRSIPTNTPATGDTYWGFVCYIEPPTDAVLNQGIVASDATVDDEQWFFLNASVEVLADTSIYLFTRIDLDPTGLNLSCSYTNSTDTFVEENDPNNYLQLDAVISVKTNLNSTFVRIDFYIRLHQSVTKDGAYDVKVYSTASGDLSDTDTYSSVFTLTMRTPSAPTKLFGAGFNASSPYVELHWTHNMLLLTLFEVQDSPNNADWTYLGQNTTREYTDTTVSNGTEVYYKVRACKLTGVGWKNSTFSDANFETVHFIMAGNGVTYLTGSIGIFLMALIILLPIIFYAVKRKR